MTILKATAYPWRELFLCPLFFKNLEKQTFLTGIAMPFFIKEVAYEGQRDKEWN